MSEWSDKVALIADLGVFFSFAQALAEADDGFAEVRYVNLASRTMAPKYGDKKVGSGFERVTHVESFYDSYGDADLIIFPDCSCGDMIAQLRSEGRRVWGSGRADLLELDREGLKDILREERLPCIPYDRVVGLDELEAYLRAPENEERWLKTSGVRGDFETFHHRKWSVSEPWLRDLQSKLGPHARDLVVLAEEPVRGIEPGWDGFTVRGAFPEVPTWGYEIKDRACAISTLNMPSHLDRAAGALAPYLAELDARGNFHLEVRIDAEGRTFIIDPCVRVGSPPGAALWAMIANPCEIVWEGAGGTLVEPAYRADWGAEIIVRSSALGAGHWVGYSIPEKHASAFRGKRPTRIGEDYAAIPGAGWDILGSAIGLGATLEEAVSSALLVAEALETEDAEFMEDAREKLAAEFAREIPAEPIESRGEDEGEEAA